jgi:hypothetical protein
VEYENPATKNVAGFFVFAAVARSLPEFLALQLSLAVYAL